MANFKSELADHVVEVLVHLLEDGVLRQEVPVVLLSHGLGDRGDGSEVHNHLLPLFRDPATHH